MTLTPAFRATKCKTCCHWERSFNFKTADRDWGACHFFGKKYGANGPGFFIDGWTGHEPRGSMTCGFHNARPEMSEEQRKLLAPQMMSEGEPA